MRRRLKAWGEGAGQCDRNESRHETQRNGTCGAFVRRERANFFAIWPFHGYKRLEEIYSLTPLQARCSHPRPVVPCIRQARTRPPGKRSAIATAHHAQKVTGTRFETPTAIRTQGHTPPHRDGRYAQRRPEQHPGRVGHGQRRLRLHPERALAGKRAADVIGVALAEDAEYGRTGVENHSEGLGGRADGHVDEVPA